MSERTSRPPADKILQHNVAPPTRTWFMHRTARHMGGFASARAARTRALGRAHPRRQPGQPRDPARPCTTATPDAHCRPMADSVSENEQPVGRTARTRPAPGHRIPHRPTTRLPHDRPRARRILISVIWLSRRGRRDGKGIAAGGTTAMLDDANDRRGARHTATRTAIDTIIVGGRARGGRGSLRRIRR